MSNKSTSWKSLKAWQETDYPISPFLALPCLWHKILPYKGFVSRQPLSITDSNCKRFSRCCDGEMSSCWRYAIMPGHTTHPSLRDISLGGRHARTDVCIAYARCNSWHGGLGGSH